LNTEICEQGWNRSFPEPNSVGSELAGKEERSQRCLSRRKMADWNTRRRKELGYEAKFITPTIRPIAFQ